MGICSNNDGLRRGKARYIHGSCFNRIFLASNTVAWAPAMSRGLSRKARRSFRRRRFHANSHCRANATASQSPSGLPLPSVEPLFSTGFDGGRRHCEGEMRRPAPVATPQSRVLRSNPLINGPRSSDGTGRDGPKPLCLSLRTFGACGQRRASVAWEFGRRVRPQPGKHHCR